jgi:hypothetical protein
MTEYHITTLEIEYPWMTGEQAELVRQKADEFKRTGKPARLNLGSEISHIMHFEMRDEKVFVTSWSNWVGVDVGIPADEGGWHTT